MKIAVCIKQVPVSNAVCVDPVTHTLVRGSAEAAVNPADLNALEAAIRLKESDGAEVVVFTMGPSAAEKALRTALSMGADEACLLCDRAFAGGDTLATARVLAAGLTRWGTFDLILTGAESSDGATGQVGPMLAELLSLPHVCDAQSLDAPADGRLCLVKKAQNAAARVRVRLPALVTVLYGSNDARLPTLRSQLAAKKKSVTVYTNAELELSLSKIGLDGSPTVALDSFAPERKKTAQMLTGAPETVAAQLLALMEKEKGGA